MGRAGDGCGTLELVSGRRWQAGSLPQKNALLLTRLGHFDRWWRAALIGLARLRARAGGFASVQSGSRARGLDRPTEGNGKLAALPYVEMNCCRRKLMQWNRLWLTCCCELQGLSRPILCSSILPGSPHFPNISLGKKQRKKQRGRESIRTSRFDSRPL
jgi:hypothetical protein